VSALPLASAGSAGTRDPQTAAATGPRRLPALRDELRLLPAAANADGSPAWMIQDPVVNRFFRIGWLDFELLLRWQNGTVERVVDAVCDETLLQAEDADVTELLQFLMRHDLLKADSPQAVERLRERARRMRRTPFEWLLHNYLFFRLPLIHPQRALVRLLSHLGWIYTRATAVSVIGLTLVGVYLAARQWDAFRSTFVDQLSWSGLVGYTIALCCAKALHELGHALTATRYGVRVAHMGVAFLVMFPMLYTDTSESWKLGNARQRLAIASAGLITELGLAGLATFGWNLAPEGTIKSALFFLATISWLLTLAVNASPFMRFDGYFITMDLLDFPNLHERAGAMARAWLRRRLLGWDAPDPEQLAGRRNAWLAAFALFTWTYRLTVFLGIALLVYHYFFKLLGAALMAVELVWFIGRPIAAEWRVWFAGRADIKPDRRRWAIGLLLVSLALVLVPWQRSVQGPGWLHAERQQVVYAPLPGRIVSLPRPGAVTAGQFLFVLESPDMRLEGNRAAAQAEARDRELVGLAGLPDGEDRRAQVQGQRDQFDAEARMYRVETARLQLTAPFAGIATDIDPQLAPGVWVQPRQALATVIDPSRWVVEAFVTEDEIARIHRGQDARVHTGALGVGFLRGHVVEIDQSRTAVLPDRMLDAQVGGPIVTLAPGPSERRTDASAPMQGQAPRDSLYRVKIALDGRPQQDQAALGRVVIDGDARAWLPAALERAASVLIRESGF
jgi:putative peptide zinc metalloprotease protein